MSSDLAHLLRTIIVGNDGGRKSRLAERIAVRANRSAEPPTVLGRGQNAWPCYSQLAILFWF
jgi:hypothetical protein